MKRSTGIPTDQLAETTKDDPRAMLHPSGKYVVQIMHHQAASKSNILMANFETVATQMNSNLRSNCCTLVNTLSFASDSWLLIYSSTFLFVAAESLNYADTCQFWCSMKFPMQKKHFFAVYHISAPDVNDQETAKQHLASVGSPWPAPTTPAPTTAAASSAQAPATVAAAPEKK
ncbi:CBR-TAG protein [Ditylenchus destructor]|nr:CBR-TAG protein [Ditylenchus destructor]